jgi:hypothetical protein
MTSGSCAYVACNGSADCTQGSATMCCQFGSSALHYCGAQCF